MASQAKLNVVQDSPMTGVTQKTKPLPLGEAALLFGIPALVFAFATYVAMPFLESRGVPPLHSMLAAYTVPLALLLVAALVTTVQVEGVPPTRRALASRMWYQRLRWRDVFWAVGIFVVSTLAVGGMAMAERFLVNEGIVPIPDKLPLLLDPNAQLTRESLAEAAGGPLAGQWGLVLLYIVYLFLNIAGEELWWRGTLLPRQVMQHGKAAWLVHGVLWTLFHAFKWWGLLSTLPLALLMAYASQRTRSNWPALLNHLVGNSVYFVMVLVGVMGL